MATDQSDSFPKARLLLQQCLSARLQVQPATGDREAEFVNIKEGLIIYVCFLKGATESIVEKLVKAALNARLSENDDGKRVSVLDLPGDVLIIPQATLGGILKGKVMQYHRNISKEDGAQLYSKFISSCKDTFDTNNKVKCINKTVESGTYGNRQEINACLTEFHCDPFDQSDQTLKFLQSGIQASSALFVDLKSADADGKRKAEEFVNDRARIPRSKRGIFATKNIEKTRSEHLKQTTEEMQRDKFLSSKDCHALLGEPEIKVLLQAFIEAVFKRRASTTSTQLLYCVDDKTARNLTTDEVLQNLACAHAEADTALCTLYGKLRL
ncbi:hypothetical protein ScPMuIL_014135 [Solemya velum]